MARHKPKQAVDDAKTAAADAKRSDDQRRQTIRDRAADAKTRRDDERKSDAKDTEPAVTGGTDDEQADAITAAAAAAGPFAGAARILSEVSKAVDAGQRGLGANVTGSTSVAAAERRAELLADALRMAKQAEQDRADTARRLAESQPPTRARLRSIPSAAETTTTTVAVSTAAAASVAVDNRQPAVVRESPFWPEPKRAVSPSSRSSIQTRKEWSSKRKDRLIRLNVLAYATFVVIVCLIGMSLISWTTSGHWYSPPPGHNHVFGGG